MGKLFAGLWHNAVWAFLGLLLALSGFGNLLDPETFSTNVVLDNISTYLVQFYGGMTLAGGILIIIGAGTRRRMLESAGWKLVLPSILLVFTIFVLTGSWNRLSVNVTYLAFALVILSRIFQLRREVQELKLAQDLLLKLRTRRVHRGS